MSEEIKGKIEEEVKKEQESEEIVEEKPVENQLVPTYGTTKQQTQTEEVEEEIREAEFEDIEKDTEKNKKPMKPVTKKGIWVSIIGIIVLGSALGLSLKRCTVVEQPEEPKSPEENIGDKVQDNFGTQTGITESSVVVKEGETLPWFVMVTQDDQGNSSYSVILTGDYNQFINVEPAEGNESQTLRAIMSLTVDKVAVDGGAATINEKIKNAKKDDFTHLCSYHVNEAYEDAFIKYCSTVEEYKDAEFDFNSARIVDLRANESLTNGLYKMTDQGNSYVVAKRTLIDANGKVLSIELGASYTNVKELKALTEVASGNNEEYEYEDNSFTSFRSLTEAQKAQLQQFNQINDVVLSGKYYEPVKEIAPEEAKKVSADYEGVSLPVTEDGYVVLHTSQDKRYSFLVEQEALEKSATRSL